ncbi:hypothetical protein [Rhizobium skierniewicense]|uniref:hypothetical protein n=1 Tax=Rhizobium skierniewicense TaxID=984260 RepID=UPI001572EEA8|nr:hypothetical protein [Rhizobium skierniewicense]NTF31824.1 hypothetical protein [Rhizobium skierniewicense]
MMRRPKQGYLNAVAAFAAIIGVLLFSFASPGTHSLSLHASVVEASSHGHDHGGHSHDEFDVGEADVDPSDHHHADHSHEKAGLVAVVIVEAVSPSLPSYLAFSEERPDRPPYTIERPPRAVALI